jgi:hypothetical protein
MLGILTRLIRPASIEAIAVLTTERTFRGRLTINRNGLDLSFDAERRRHVEASIEAGRLHDFSPAISQELDQRIRASLRGTQTRAVILLVPDDLRRLQQRARQIGAVAPNEDVTILIDPFANYRGLLLPKRSTQHIPLQAPSKEKAMSTLKHDVPKAHAILQAHCDDPNDALSEVWVAGYLKAQNKLRVYYTLKCPECVRPKSLTDAEIEKFAIEYAGHVAKRHYAAMPGPEVAELGDVTMAAQSLYGQSENTNTVLVLIYIAYGEVGGTVLTAELDSELPQLSAELLSVLGRMTKAAATESVGPHHFN